MLSMSEMMRSLLWRPPQIAQWMALYSAGGLGKAAAASSRVGWVTSRQAMGGGQRQGQGRQQNQT